MTATSSTTGRALEKWDQFQAACCPIEMQKCAWVLYLALRSAGTSTITSSSKLDKWLMQDCHVRCRGTVAVVWPEFCPRTTTSPATQSFQTLACIQSMACRTSATFGNVAHPRQSTTNPAVDQDEALQHLRCQCFKPLRPWSQSRN